MHRRGSPFAAKPGPDSSNRAVESAPGPRPARALLPAPLTKIVESWHCRPQFTGEAALLGEDTSPRLAALGLGRVLKDQHGPRGQCSPARARLPTACPSSGCLRSGPIPEMTLKCPCPAPHPCPPLPLRSILAPPPRQSCPGPVTSLPHPQRSCAEARQSPDSGQRGCSCSFCPSACPLPAPHPPCPQHRLGPRPF